jgi:hypothetical protein
VGGILYYAVTECLISGIECAAHSVRGSGTPCDQKGGHGVIIAVSA